MVNLMKSDGNGGLIIPHWFVAVLAILITLISCVATVVAMGTTVKNNVQTNTELLEMITPKVIDGEKNEGIIKTRVDSVDSDISYIKQDLSIIKQDIKELLKEKG